MAGFDFVTFTTDYGLEDEFVGICHGVVQRIAPQVRVIDICHGLQPHDVLAGAMVLAQAVPFMPPAVHVAVVDPDVGTRRLPLVIATAEGLPLVGPDNGVLWMAAAALGGATAAYAVERADLVLQPRSRTFDGRDVFAPVAAHLALGLEPGEVGPSLPVESLTRIEVPPARVDDDHVHAQIVTADHFGNLQLNVRRQDLEGAGVLTGDTLEMRVGGKPYTVLFCETFAEIPAGRLAILEDSFRLLTIAANRASAARQLEARRGDPIILARLPRERS